MKLNFSAWLKERMNTLMGVLFIILLSASGVVAYIYYSNNKTYDWDTDNYGYIDSDAAFGAKYLMEFLQEEWKGEIITVTSYEDFCDEYSSSRKKYNLLLLNQDIEHNVYSFENEDPSDYDDEELDSIATDEYEKEQEETSEIPKALDVIAKKISSGSNAIINTSVGIGGFFGLASYYINGFWIYNHKNNPQDITPWVITNDSNRIVCHLWSDMFERRYKNKVTDNQYTEQLFPNIDHKQTYPLVIDENKDIVGMLNHIGKGRVSFIGTKALFSNYGMSREDTRKMVRYIMDRTFDESLPLIVIADSHSANSNYQDYDSSHIDLLSVMLSHSGTALAVWLLLALLLLTLIFNVRRRRNAVQENDRQRNASINYTKHLASLYDASSDYKELLITEQRMLLYKFRKDYRYDIRTHSFTLPSQFAPMIAQSQSLDENQVSEALKSLEYYANKEGTVSERWYIKCIESIEFIR